jgi:hypothetical protein
MSAVFLLIVSGLYAVPPHHGRRHHGRIRKLLAANSVRGIVTVVVALLRNGSPGAACQN